MQTQKGDRVRLRSTSDPRTKLQRGAEGTVDFVDSLGTVFVQWDPEIPTDRGSTLGLIPGEDRWDVVS